MILTKVLGHDYVSKFDIHELICSKKNSVGSSAEPLKATWKGKRIMFSSEPPKTAILNSSVLKDLTSGESVSYRLNFSNNYITFKPVFKIHIMCNELPEIDSGDQGVCRRIRNIEYTSRFVPNDDDVNHDKFIFKMKNDVLEMFQNDSYKLAFFNLLIEHLDIQWDFNAPLEIMEATKNYFLDCDHLKQFIDVYLEKTENETDWITLKQIKDTIQETDFKNDIHITRSFRNELCNILGVECVKQARFGTERHSNVFFGWKFKNLQIQ